MAPAEASSVLIVSRDTNNALVAQAYFQLCDIAATTCNRVEAPGDFRGISTVVVFPDDFSALSSAQGVRHARWSPRLFAQALRSDRLPSDRVFDLTSVATTSLLPPVRSELRVPSGSRRE